MQVRRLRTPKKEMKHIEIINGPNLNLTGLREPKVYGCVTMEEKLKQLRAAFPEVEIGYYQSNVEGELINYIQQTGFSADGLIVNLGGYSHTSVALRDALLSVPAAKIEVHRHHSLITSACRGMICGLGLEGYRLAIEVMNEE